MQFTAKFTTLACGVLVALTSAVTASPTSEAAPDYLVSHEEMLNWIKTTDAKLTFVGKPINPLTARDAQSTIVTYCNTRSFDVCGGICTVYNGGAKCLAAPGTQCLSATKPVSFCADSRCSGPCNPSSNCGTPLANGFCYTPNTNSILVSGAFVNSALQASQRYG